MPSRGFLAACKAKGCASRKLASSRGESITEVLVAMVVAGLAILMLATAISAASTVNMQSRDAMAEYYDLNNALVQANASGLSSSEAADAATGTGTVMLQARVGSGETASTISLSFSPDSKGSAVATVKYVVSEQLRGALVASYERTGAAS